MNYNGETSQCCRDVFDRIANAAEAHLARNYFSIPPQKLNTNGHYHVRAIPCSMTRHTFVGLQCKIMSATDLVILFTENIAYLFAKGTHYCVGSSYFELLSFY